MLFPIDFMIICSPWAGWLRVEKVDDETTKLDFISIVDLKIWPAFAVEGAVPGYLISSHAAYAKEVAAKCA